MSCLRIVDALATAKDLSVLVVKVLLVVIWRSFMSIWPDRRKPLKGEVVLVTGAGQGLGKELALKFAEQEAKLVLWDVNQGKVDSLALEIRKAGGNARSYMCDVTKENDVISAAQLVRQEVGDVTILVNNAGIMQNLPVLQLNSDRIRQTFSVNVLSNFWTIRAFLPSMLEKDKGHIVAISSVAGLFGTVNCSDYSASKYALVGLMESVEEEVRLMKKKVCFTTICPVAIETGMIQNTDSRYPLLLPVLSVEKATAEIIDAIRKEKCILGIPCTILLLSGLKRFLPCRATHLIHDFLKYCRLPNTDNGENI